MASFKKRILVAEDDLGVRDLVRTQLSMAGYEVHTAINGREAVRRVMELRPTLLILDINMPELDGFGVLSALSERNMPPVRTMMLTARHASDDIRKALALGAKDYLSKPFNDSQLLARVARQMRPPRLAVSAGALEL